MKTKRGKETSLKECLMRNLGIKSTEEINNWYQRYYDNGYRLDGLDKAKEIIESYKEKEIHIIGDYDVDGVTATSIMYFGLKYFGCEKVFYRTPKRFSEGFGLKESIIREIPENDCLIITVDNGTAAPEAVKYAKERGMKVIITDHHLPNLDTNGDLILPEADLIINPNAIEGSADYKGYCGAGIAYKLCRHLLDNEGLSRSLEPIAAIGTIADVMELREENYVIVRRGLEGLIKTPNLGLRALLEKLGKTEHVSATDVGFNIGPCINAPGRLIDDGSMKAVELITASNQYDAERLAEFLVQQNEIRKTQVNDATEAAIEDIETNKKTGDIPIISYIPKINEGILGIIAAKIMDKYSRPAIILTDSEAENILKGSARAPEGFNMKAVLDRVSKEMTNYGGHEGAAGLSIKRDNLENFREEIIKSSVYEKYLPVTDTDITYDFEVSSENIDEAADLIEMFEPHGEGNPTVMIKVPDFFNVPYGDSYKTPMGKTGIKFYGDNCTAINFQGAKLFEDIKKPEKMVLYGELSYNYFKGRKTPQIIFQDFEMISEISDEPNDTPFADILAVRASLRS